MIGKFFMALSFALMASAVHAQTLLVHYCDATNTLEADEIEFLVRGYLEDVDQANRLEFAPFSGWGGLNERREVVIMMYDAREDFVSLSCWDGFGIDVQQRRALEELSSYIAEESEAQWMERLRAGDTLASWLVPSLEEDLVILFLQGSGSLAGSVNHELRYGRVVIPLLQTELAGGVQ